MSISYIFLLVFLVEVVYGDMGALIIGGIQVPTSNKDFQSIVSLQDKKMGSMSHFCGGSLINPSWVLTAGHCVSKGGKPSQVRIGSYDNKKGGYVRKISKMVLHPNYAGTRNNDFALLKLDKPVEGTNVKFMKLDNGKYDKDKTPLVSIGWGYTKEGSGNVVQNLRQVDLEVITNKFCSTMYYGQINYSMLCTWGKWDNKKKQRKDACSGDSGSPNFWYDKKTGETVVVGVTSWGRGCGRKNYAGVTARVSHVINWINKVAVHETKRPTLSHTPRPTRPLPTNRPTRVPTPRPTNRPSVSPTPRPTRPTTSRPTKNDIGIPPTHKFPDK
jgi:trypsin